MVDVAKWLRRCVVAAVFRGFDPRHLPSLKSPKKVLARLTNPCPSDQRHSDALHNEIRFTDPEAARAFRVVVYFGHGVARGSTDSRSR